MIINTAISLIQQSGITYEVGPMETTIEGEFDTIFGLVRSVLESSIQYGEIFVGMKLIHNPNGIMTIQEKVDKFRK